jgi:hypothetical protein
MTQHKAWRKETIATREASLQATVTTTTIYQQEQAITITTRVVTIVV